jgi:dTDP-4-dehydro-6-deoxy-alpha-D-glucopyranose 2,3-dehydratase
MKDKILNLIKSSEFNITENVEFYVDLLDEVIKNQIESTDITEILQWFEDKRKNYPVETQEIGLKDLDKWNVDSVTGNVTHESGKFFSLIGVKIYGAQGREVTSWTQPMIKQNECGILGILCQKIKGVKHYLLYAKYEPGNLGKLQFSPTLQATASNLSQAHGGKKPLFAEYFEEGGKGKIIRDVESVEDGGRFYLKTNRNMIVEVDETEELNVPSDFVWVNLSQFKELLRKDLLVNNLVRSVMGSW